MMTATTSAPVYTQCPRSLTPEHIVKYHTDGYLAFENMLSAQEVECLKRALWEMVRDLHAQTLSGEAIVKKGSDLRNHSGLLIDSKKFPGHSLLFEPDANLDPMNDSLDRLDENYRKIRNPSVHPAVKALTEDDRIIGLVADLLGPKPIMHGEMALCKPARIGTEKPWHQDGAYFSFVPPEAGVDIWIALDDATVENGCMHVLPGAHRLGPKKHIHRDDCELAEGRLDLSQAVPVELHAGGILLFSTILPHQTPPNFSNQRRRALQFFYRGANTRQIEREVYRRLFTEGDGTPAACGV
jgi:phytanoyl-CoA hydroxylase